MPASQQLGVVCGLRLHCGAAAFSGADAGKCRARAHSIFSAYTLYFPKAHGCGGTLCVAEQGDKEEALIDEVTIDHGPNLGIGSSAGFINLRQRSQAGFPVCLTADTPIQHDILSRSCEEVGVVNGEGRTRACHGITSPHRTECSEHLYLPYVARVAPGTREDIHQGRTKLSGQLLTSLAELASQILSKSKHPPTEPSFSNNVETKLTKFECDFMTALDNIVFF